MLEGYLSLWPIAASCTLLGLLSASSIVHRRRTWWTLTFAAVALSLALYVPWMSVEASDPKNNWLSRDIAGAIIFAAGLPLIAGWLGMRLAAAGTIPLLRSLGVLAIIGILLGASPMYFLLVHCTSGDCL